MILILYKSDGTHRRIYTDGRGLPKEIEQPAWLGYSVARWEPDTLVVDTAGFNDRTGLDLMGHPHSDALHITERYRRRDLGHIDVDMTFDDAPSVRQALYHQVHRGTGDRLRYLRDLLQAKTKRSAHTAFKRPKTFRSATIRPKSRLASARCRSLWEAKPLIR
jgi:hypothetical protein